MQRLMRNVLAAAAVGMVMVSAAAPSFAEEVIVKVRPPALRAEVIPPSPGVDFIWRPGYWRWGGTEHVWVGGEWMRRPRPGAEWVAGHWGERGGGWVWVEGHWR